MLQFSLHVCTHTAMSGVASTEQKSFFAVAGPLAQYVQDRVCYVQNGSLKMNYSHITIGNVSH